MDKAAHVEEMKKLLAKDGAQVVITGDSLSYNRYDFDPEPRINAYDCLPGIESWSFLLRDAIHRQDPWFQHGDELKLACRDARTSILTAQMASCVFPYQNRNISVVVEDSEEEVSFSLDRTQDGRPARSQAVLYFGRVPEDHAAQFDIYMDGQYQAKVENGGHGKKFQGYEPFSVVLPLAANESTHRVVFKNWCSSPSLKAVGSTRKYVCHLLAVGSRLVDVHLTGQGDRTADWLLENLEERVTFCRPDAVVVIIGANDRVYRTTEQFEQNLKRLIAEIRAVNAETQLLFLSPPYAGDDDSGEKYVCYHQIMKEVTEQQQCLFFDLIDFFADVPVADWRYDHVHFTRYGNRLLAEALIKQLLPADNCTNASALPLRPGAAAGNKFMSVKKRATLWTHEKRAAARENIAAYAWAREQADAVCRLADEYAMQAERIYELIVAEGLPRYYHTGHTLDPKIFYCRYCSVNICEKYGNHYPWIVKPLENPWKIQCPDCKRLFPSNDFGGFYRLGLDAHGVFQHAQAMQKNEESRLAGGPDYLQNELYPEMGEGWGVDDGFGYYTGYVYDNGVRERHNYIATYLDRGLWGGGHGGGIILEAINALAQAYVYTGEARYGRAGAMLLDRVADFYPGYDWYPWAEFRGAENFRGKICDAIWECFVTRQLASAYDAFYPVYEDAVLIACLREKSLRYAQENPKDSASAIRTNTENGILREIYRGCRTGRISGNFGMEQAALATAAVVLDAMPETGEWLAWIMAPGTPRNQGDPAQDTPITGGNVRGVLLGSVDRDGMGDEASPDYNALWLNLMVDLAEVLHEYDGCPGMNLYDNPKFAQMFTAHVPLMMAEYYMAQIGDSGRTASKGFTFRMDTALSGYRHLGGVRLAQYIHRMNGNTAENLHGGITDRDPEAIRRNIENVIREFGPLDVASDMMTGYGFAALRDGEKTAHSNTLRDFSLYFGLGTGHGHADALNLGINAFGLNFAPDLGYPEVTGTQPNRLQWVSGTMSHNTVMVDGRMQSRLAAAGTPLHYDDAGRVKLMDVEAGRAYPQTRAYRRSVVMVDAGDGVSYGVDFFRILGGDDHLFSFHAQSNTIHETRGLALIPQTDESGQFVGSYAGSEVAWGQDPNTVETSWEVDMLRYPPGATWLYEVRRDRGPERHFMVDFRITDFRRVLPEKKNLHLRMTMLADFAPDEVAIARAKPPHFNTPYIPDLEYVLTRRTGNNLDSLFTTVFEPYCDTPYITDGLTTVPVAVLAGEPGREDAVKAVKIPLTNGRIDYVVYATNGEITYRVDNLFDFRGFAAVCSVREGKMDFLYGNDCELLWDVRHPGALTGLVADFTRELALANTITVALEQQTEPDALAGRYVYIENDGAQNAVYRIHRAFSHGAQILLDIGQVSPIRALGEGTAYVYNIAEGQKLRIPLSFMQS